MDFETYVRDKRVDYEAFARTVANILDAGIQSRPNLRLQQVQYRAKNPERLKQKLLGRDLLETTTLETDIKDLAGCRLVFYTNSDVSRFLNTSIVRDNFHIDWDRSKVHYPDPDTEEAADLFISNNYVAALTGTRTALPEYARFCGMYCEIQIQTSLNHAWSEMAHDTIYKGPILQGFGATIVRRIERRMTKIMREHLLPAGYEFQKVVDDFERLLAGKELFDRDTLSAFANCSDNNSRYDLLDRFANLVIPYYDDVRTVYPEIQTALVATVLDARNTAPQPIDTPFGKLPGRTLDQIVDVVGNILDQLRYVDIGLTFSAICTLFPSARTDIERERLLRLARRLSQHDRDVWERAGPYVQCTLISHVQGINDELAEPLTPVLLVVLTEILKPEVTGTTSTHESVTFHTGSVPISAELRQARRSAISVLKAYFLAATTDDDRRAVVAALTTATFTPRRGRYSNELFATILDDAAQIVDFYRSVIDKQSYEMLQDLEYRSFFLYRRAREMPDVRSRDPRISRAGSAMTRSVRAFRDVVNANSEYAIYRTLVGFQSVFPPAWDSNDFDLTKGSAYRKREIRKLVDKVTASNADDWFRILNRCARTESNDGATFLAFGQFLEQLGEHQPEIVLVYLDQLDGPLANFIAPMLRGIAKTPHSDKARAKIAVWLENGVHVAVIAWFLLSAESLDIELLQKTLEAAATTDDSVAMLTMLRASVHRYQDSPDDLFDTVFVPALEYFTARSDHRWIAASGRSSSENYPFRNLNSKQATEVLQSLVSLREIDYHAAQIIAAIAFKCPELVVDFFGERLQFAESSEIDHNFEVVPFEANGLDQPLGAIPEYLLEAARHRFHETRPLFRFHWGRLIAITFPSFPVELQDILVRILRSKQRSDIEFVIAVLRSYEGQEFLHEVAKEIIEVLPEADALLPVVANAIDATGVVEGEFGRTTALREKRAKVEAWRTDGRDKVRAFAETHIRSLDRYISAEQRESVERLEQRKRDFTADPEEGD